MILGVGFPDPIGWVIDKVTGFVGDVATGGFELMIGGLVAWVVDAVIWVVGGVFNFFLDSTDPNVQADWFITGTGPYATTVSIGASLLLLFLLAGIVQGTLSGDVGGMLRRMALELPVSVLGMVGLVTVTQMLIRLTDALSGQIIGNFQDDISDFTTVVLTLDHLSGGTSTAFVVFVLGLVTVLAGLVLVAVLVVRSALIYIVVALAPIVFATRLWPATKGASRKLLDLLVALILSKLVIAVALSVAAAAAVGTGSGGEVTALPEPESFAEDPGGSVTQAVGILLTAAAAFGVAAFSPLLVARLLPLTEAALVAQGIPGSPVRAGHQGLMMANTMQMVTGRRYSQIAGGEAGGGEAAGAGAGPPGDGPPSGSAGTGAGASGGAGAGAAGAGAAASGVGVAVVAAAKAAQATKKGIDTSARVVGETAREATDTTAEPGPSVRTAGQSTSGAEPKPGHRTPGSSPRSDRQSGPARRPPGSSSSSPAKRSGDVA
ncbi:type IV secretion system protein [Iamia majanohamensis]|uniref:Type IV secretion system protein n=1 Tax=Iamia majanohamensis TaxID=467976 RepID=A0AAE9YBA9_9ACTN|nr:type IV secretion system protein [Iamia majanohamensis]WCO67963.1 type IV secretion system protein [Iamia majanohamensis]